MQKFVMKVHENHVGSKIVAVSDPQLIGKHIEDSDKGIEITITKEFYGDSEFELQEIIPLVLASDNANLIGSEIVDAFIEEKIVDPKSVISINGIKHAQIYKI